MAFGTSTLREVADSDDFLRRIEEKTGIKVRITLGRRGSGAHRGRHFEQPARPQGQVLFRRYRRGQHGDQCLPRAGASALRELSAGSCSPATDFSERAPAASLARRQDYSGGKAAPLCAKRAALQDDRGRVASRAAHHRLERHGARAFPYLAQVRAGQGDSWGLFLKELVDGCRA